MNADHVLAVILAGGRSRRMGVPDKCLVMLHGRPILDHVLDRIRPQAAHVAINANGDPARFDRWGLPVIPDAIDGWRGPLVGLLSAMEWAARSLPQVRQVVSIPADMPFLPSDLIRRLWSGRAAQGAAVGVSDGRVNPLVGIWPVTDAPVLRAAIVNEHLAKAEFWAERRHAASVPFPAATFLGINDAADLALAERLMAS